MVKNLASLRSGSNFVMMIQELDLADISTRNLQESDLDGLKVIFLSPNES